LIQCHVVRQGGANQETMSKKMELKAYKKIAEIRQSMLSSIQQRAMGMVAYNKGEKPDDMLKEFEYIANPAKWDYCGLLSKDEKAVLEMLEFLVDDSQKEIRKYKEWKP